MGGAPLDEAGGVGDAGGSRSRRGIDVSVTQVPTRAHARGWSEISLSRGLKNSDQNFDHYYHGVVWARAWRQRVTTRRHFGSARPHCGSCRWWRPHFSAKCRVAGWRRIQVVSGVFPLTSFLVVWFEMWVCARVDHF